jgi:hypothetical protein
MSFPATGPLGKATCHTTINGPPWLAGLGLRRWYTYLVYPNNYKFVEISNEMCCPLLVMFLICGILVPGPEFMTSYVKASNWKQRVDYYLGLGNCSYSSEHVRKI